MNNIIKKIGKHTYGCDKINIYTCRTPYHVEIGSFCSIAIGTTILLGGNHRVDWVTTYPFGHITKNIFNKFDGIGHPTSKGNVIIGNDVWIGMNVTILSGVVIGDGAVIGSSAVVTKDVEPNSIVVGSPAKLVRMR